MPSSRKAEELWDAYAHVRVNEGLLRNLPVTTFGSLCRALRPPHRVMGESKSKDLITDPGTRAALIEDLERIKTIVRDMKFIGLLPDSTIHAVFVLATKDTITTFKGAVEHLEFCREHGIHVTHSLAAVVLRDLGRYGNYTAYLRLFDLIQREPFRLEPSGPLWSTMLVAIIYARVERSEPDLGYHVGPNVLADLKLPSVFTRYRGTSRKADTWALGSMEYAMLPNQKSAGIEPSPIDSDAADLQHIFAEDAFPKDLCSADMPAGSITPIRKVLAAFQRAWSAGEWETVEGAAKLTPVSVFNLAMFACSVMGRPALAIEFLRLMKSEPYNVAPDMFTYTALLHQCVLAVKHNRSAPISPNLASALGSPPSLEAAAVQRRNAVLSAESIWEDMVSRNLKPNVVAFSTMINLYCENDEPEKALHLLRLMKAVGEPPNVVTYGILINYLLEQDDTPGALAVFRQMKDQGVRPSVVIYTSLISHFRSKGNLQGMEEVWNQLTDPASPVKPNIFTVCAMAAEYGSKALPRKMLGVLDKVARSELATDSAIWNAVMDGLGRTVQLTRYYYLNERNGPQDDGEHGAPHDFASQEELKRNAKSFYAMAMEMWKSRCQRRAFDSAVVPEDLRDSFPFGGLLGPPIDMSTICSVFDMVGYSGTRRELDDAWNDAMDVLSNAYAPSGAPLPRHEAVVDNVHAAYVEALCRLGCFADARHFVLDGLRHRGDVHAGRRAQQAGLRVATTLLAMWSSASPRRDINPPREQQRDCSLVELRELVTARFGRSFMAEVDRLITELQIVGPKGAIDRIRPAFGFSLQHASAVLKIEQKQDDPWMQKVHMTAPVDKLQPPSEQELQAAAAQMLHTRGRRARKDKPTVDPGFTGVLSQIEQEAQATGGKGMLSPVIEVDGLVTEADLRRIRRRNPSEHIEAEIQRL